MRNNNSIIIDGWMVNKLKLKGNKLLAYAIVYGFSQDLESEFRGSLGYVQKALSIGKTTAIKIMTDLENDGLIFKRKELINGLEYNRYGVESGPVQKVNLPSSESEPGTGSESELYKGNTNKGNTKGKETYLKTLFEKEKKPTKKSAFAQNTEWQELWDFWKDYKKKEFKFTYKSEVSELVGQKQLIELSGGIFENAQKIVSNSIANGYKGLFANKNEKLTKTENYDEHTTDQAREALRKFRERK